MAATAQALGPPAAAIVAILLVFATGLDQHANLPASFEAQFYGFFLDRYPLFAAAIVYGLARIVVILLRPGRSGLLRRVLGGSLALALLLGASLYPTFGGLVLRSAFATGGVAFLGQQSMGMAYVLGAAAAAFVFGLVLGLGGVLVAGRIGRGSGWRRTLARGSGHLLIRYVSLWFALAVLGLAHAAGFGAWPRRPLTGADTMAASFLVIVAFLPHACLNRMPFRLPRGPGSAPIAMHVTA